MAATRLIALHINKGKTVAQCLADRTDYSENAAQQEIKEMMSKMKLIEDDIKGAAVDTTL